MLKKISKALSRYKKHYIYSKKNDITKNCVIGKKASLRRCKLKDHSRVAAYAALVQTEVGEYSSIGRYTKITHTTIGKFCAISWDTTINAIGHPYDNLSISAFPYVPSVGNFVKERKTFHKQVIIKNDVWIGANCVIMPGLTIGNGAIVGSGSVVTKDVPDYAIVVGVPAKVIKYRFSDEIIKELQELQWWNLDYSIIKQNIHLWQNKLDDETVNKLKELL